MNARSSRTRRLSASQLRMLRRLARGSELAPGGQPHSGREASAWYRTLKVLVRNGLASRAGNLYARQSCEAAITDLGRARLACCESSEVAS
jgi:hypothetical protein